MFAGGKKKIARIVERDMHPGILQRIAIELRKQRRGADDGRFDLDDVQALEFRVGRESRCRHAATKADEKHAARRTRERAKMAEQALRGDVVVRGIHFSVGAQGNIIFGPRHGNRGIQAIGKIDDVHQMRIFPQSQRPVVKIPIHDGIKCGHGGIVKIIGEADEADGDEQGRI